MRNVPAALQTHIDGEVLSLTRCIKITRTDGVVMRLTTHDLNLTVNGDVYYSGIPLEMTALESTDTLAVDNAELTIGIDETTIKTADFNAGLYDGASFELFLVNWQSVGDGVIYLKRGTFGDAEISDGVLAKVQLRGLTHLLQRPVVERYSLTCRAALGSRRCGAVNSPTRIRRPNQKVKTWDWFLVPYANVTTPTISNLDFETAALADWTVPSGSSWTRSSTLTAYTGTYYAGSGTGSSGQELPLYRDLTTAALGMINGNIDTGDYSLDFYAQIMGTSPTYTNSGKMFIEQYNAAGVTIKRDESEWIRPSYNEWQGVGVTAFILPSCRTVRVGFLARVDSGTAGHIAFDAAGIRFWTNESSTWNGTVFRTVKIPAYAASERLTLDNSGFEANGAVANTNVSGMITGWSIPSAASYWQIVGSSGGLSAAAGSYFLLGGDDGSTTPNSVYELRSTIALPSDATAANITAGWYLAELQLKVAKTDANSAPRYIIEFLDSTSAVISSVDSGYITTLAEDTWTDKSISSRVPSTTTQVRVRLLARSGSGSAANAAFDAVSLYFFPTAYEHDEDEELGFLSGGTPSFAYGALDYTADGDAIVQAKTPNFYYGTVTGVTSRRVFASSGISDTAALLYSGKVVWLSGNNAGTSSYIRIWDNGTKVVKLYDDTKATIQIGDKFVYARGCDKTIDRCADVFGNAHNFRGEPYLPGSSRVIEFLVATES